MFRLVFFVGYLLSFVQSFSNFEIKRIKRIKRPFDTPICIEGRYYLVDIDNTICLTNDADYKNCIPLYNRIIKLNDLYELGHEIHYWTSRCEKRNPGLNEITIRQLNWWGVKYDSLSVGKPYYDVMFDASNSYLLDNDIN